MRIRGLFFSLFIIATSLKAQSFHFIAVNGAVQYEEQGSWKKAIAGTKLPDGSKIKLDNNAYAALSFQKKQTLELKAAGTYNFNDLKTKISQAPSSLTSKYVDYIASNAGQKPNANTLSNKGMVSRALGNAPHPFLPANQSFIMEDMVTFVWRSPKKNEPFVFILSSDEKPIFQRDTRDTLLTVNVSELNIKPNTCYYWRVYPKHEPNTKGKEYCVKFYDKEQRNQIYKEVQEIQKDLGNTAIAKLVLGKYYQDKGLSIEAFNHYLQASDSGIEEYKKYFEQYFSEIMQVQ